MFLTPDELRELTGYRRSSLQLAWLRKAGVRHYVRKDGRPVVLHADLAGRAPERERPDFSKAAASR